MRQDKKESILSTAKQMFDRYGIRKTNLDEVAKRARVAKATIYNYFGNKDQVYIEVLKRQANEVIEKLSDAIEQVKSPLEKFKAFIYTRFRQMREAMSVLDVYHDWNIPISSKVKNVRELFSKEKRKFSRKSLKTGQKKESSMGTTLF